MKRRPKIEFTVTGPAETESFWVENPSEELRDALGPNLGHRVNVNGFTRRLLGVNFDGDGRIQVTVAAR